jgi:hypothetical protein
MRPLFAATLIAWSHAAQAQTLALFTDAAPSPIEVAAIELGLHAEVFTDAATFAAAAAQADIVAIDSLMQWPDLTVEQAIAQAVSNQQLVIYSSWALASAPSTQAALGVTAVEYTDALRHAATDEGPNLLGEIGGVLFPSTRFSAPVDGQYLALTGAGWYAAADVVTGRGTIAVTHNSRVIINGLVGYDYQDVDRNRDGLSDAANLYVAELDMLLGGAGSVGLAVSGRCSSKLTLHISGLVPYRAFAVASSSSIGLGAATGGACAGAPLGLAAGGLGLLYYRGSASGSLTLSVPSQVPLCGRYLQVVDMATCAASNVMGPF